MVLTSSTEDAQTALLYHLLTFSVGRIEEAFKLGSSIGLDLGDVSLVPGGVVISSIGRAGQLMWVRNNIVVLLSKSPGNSPLDLAALAGMMDYNIRNQTDYSARELTTVSPRVTTFQPASSSIRPNSSTPVSYTVADPRSLRLESEFSATVGSLETTAPHAQLTYFSNERAGTWALRCVASNEALLFTVATSSITVQE